MKKYVRIAGILIAVAIIYWFGFYKTPEQRKFAQALAAANRGDVSAQVSVGDYYARGVGTDTNASQAMEWYRKAALGGSAEAQWRCAQEYISGKLVAQDLEEAAVFLLLGVKQGDVRAQEELSNFYAEGLGGLTKHAGESAFWAWQAAQKNQEAQARQKWRELEQQSPALCEQVKVFSQNFKQAQAGDAMGRFRVGQAYLEGKPVLSNAEEAARWLTAAWQEDQLPQAGFLLAQMYETGRGVPADAEAADALLAELARLPYAPAQYVLGSRAYYGNPPQYKEAFGWFSKAAAGGHAPGQYMTGFMLLRGQGTNSKVSQGIHFLTLAANQDYDPAQYLLGWMYLKGQHVARNPKTARYWLERASQNGNIQAQVLLAKKK